MTPNVFQKLKISPIDVLIETEKTIKQKPIGIYNSVQLPFTPRVKRVLSLAIDEARNKDFIGPEHILIGLLQEEEGLAYEILNKFHLPEADKKEQAAWANVAQQTLRNFFKEEVMFQPMPQKQAFDLLSPTINSTGQHYSKFGSVLFRQAKISETIITKTPDGRVETTNTANAGDFIVRNPTGEEYVLTPQKFAPRYSISRHAATITLPHGEYIEATPKGRCLAVILTSDIIKQLHIPMNDKNEFCFIADWGEAMIAVEGDMLCCPVNDNGHVGNEVYRIEKTAFSKTYAKD
jgi:hypothetical protein